MTAPLGYLGWAAKLADLRGAYLPGDRVSVRMSLAGAPTTAHQAVVERRTRSGWVIARIERSGRSWRVLAHPDRVTGNSLARQLILARAYRAVQRTTRSHDTHTEGNAA